MAEISEQTKTPDKLELFVQALEQGTLNEVRRQLGELHPAEIAHILESIPAEARETVWELLPAEPTGEILLHLNEELRARLMERMAPEDLVAATEGLDTDDLADILPAMPEQVVQEVMLALEEQERQRLESVLSYPEDTAGGLMDLDTLVVRGDISLDVVLRYLRWRREIPETTDTLFVVNRDGKYMGLLTLRDLLTNDPTLTVAELMQRDVEGIPADMPDWEVAQLFQHRDLVTAPVVDSDGKLLGRITIDDVVDVIRDDADHSLMSMAGLTEEEDMFSPVLKSARRRTLWLGVNLLTAFLASWVIAQFDATIEKLVALAILMPIVASMGGIAGSQTLTLVVRGLALGQISKSNARQLLRKELLVGVLNGLIWAVVIAGVASLWFDNTPLGVVIAAAIVVNLFVAALAGALVPLMLRRFGADPALAGSVVLTTVTDVVGFLAFLGLATLFLL
ncbi:MAG: magnesium transporter [Gammaproteobacteria bacterium SG8_47]|nr:MAG: magnesium transporter [Gammaproteobacteria bacterium SG8_47]